MIWSTCLIPVHVDLDNLAEVVFVSLFHCQVTLFFPLHIVVLFGRKSLCVTHSSGTGSYTPMREQLPMSIIWNSSAWETGLLSHMYSVIYLYQYGPIDIHFILWGIIPKDDLLNLLCCTFCCSFGHWKLITAFFDIILLLQGFFFFFFKHFLFDTIRFPQTPLLYFLSESYNQ